MLYIFFLISWQCHNEIKTHFNVFFNCCPWLFIHNAQVLAMQQMVTLPFVISSSSVLFKSQTSNHHISFINKSSIHNYQGWQPMMYAKDKMIHHHPGVVKRILHRDARNCTSFTESKPLQSWEDNWLHLSPWKGFCSTQLSCKHGNNSPKSKCANFFSHRMWRHSKLRKNLLDRENQNRENVAPARDTRGTGR